ncbi:MAG TPA: ABC transporter ATP-binding protein, partial [Candidatus Hydrogenedens sp.]|nr:ABC transporter ATP-binding protein [Candidatus Hydrogenedens sp.]
VSDRVLVMYLGKIVEEAPTEQLFNSPNHPYTQALLSAIPKPDPGATLPKLLAQGEPPSPINPPTGCSFHPRCPYATEQCCTEEPLLQDISEAHRSACWIFSTSDKKYTKQLITTQNNEDK